MYQCEVKRALVEQRFPPQDGWRVTINFDVQEKGKGHAPDPAKQAAFAGVEACLKGLAVTMGGHPDYPKADFVAERDGERWVIEVEGHSKGQDGDKVYSALGQLLTRMRKDRPARYAIAVHEKLKGTALKVPPHVRKRLDLTLFVVSPTDLKEFAP